MDPPMVDCRSLIDFCKAFEKHRALAAASASNTNNNHRTNPSRNTLNPLSHPFAAIDAVILLLVLAAAAVLALPYLRLILHQASHRLFPAIVDIVGDAMYHAPVAYGFGFVLAFVASLAVWEFLSYRSRKCGNPTCQGLKKAVQFDIQIESHECVNSFRFAAGHHHKDTAAAGPTMQMGSHREELEAQLKKMAPPNGRTVLICRAPCGCSAGRMEVWGAKKNRRTTKR